MLRRLPELGIDFIDTADSYGPEVSERLIADELAPPPPIPGTSSVKHLEENTAAAHVQLSDPDFAELDAQGKKEWKIQAGR